LESTQIAICKILLRRLVLQNQKRTKTSAFKVPGTGPKMLSPSEQPQSSLSTEIVIKKFLSQDLSSKDCERCADLKKFSTGFSLWTSSYLGPANAHVLDGILDGAGGRVLLDTRVEPGPHSDYLSHRSYSTSYSELMPRLTTIM
jgi:hypothetical protein